MKFLETIDQLKLNKTRATALVSNSIKIQMLEVRMKEKKVLDIKAKNAIPLNM